ncbi:MAG: CHAT domain-containing protein [Chloroflexi bacterium]|nr:CHAT domain-containing protein [Chloroflexota bacterium]
MSAAGELNRYDLIHFATHACVEPEQPRLSSIALCDADLTVQELLAWSLDAHLVVVSACESAAATTFGGEERAGIETALLAAGVANVLTSLWSVDDARVPAFMAAFVHHYATCRDGGLALAQAQRAAMLASGDAAQALWWAGWRVTGMG